MRKLRNNVFSPSEDLHHSDNNCFFITSNTPSPSLKKMILAYGIASILTAFSEFTMAKGRSLHGTTHGALVHGDPARAAAQSMAIGHNANAISHFSLALGNNSNSNEDRSISIGHNSQVLAVDSIAVGNNSSVAGDRSIAVGNNTNTLSINSMAIGMYAQAAQEGGMAIGPYSTSTGKNSVSIGFDSKSSSDYATALGYYSKATRKYDNKLKSSITKEMSIELQQEKNIHIGELSIGGGEYNSANKGAYSVYSQITHVAPGIEDTDAVNLLQAKNIVKRETEELKNRLTLTSEQFMNDAKKATEAAKEHQKTTESIVARLKDEASTINKTVNQNADGTMHIGKDLDGKTLSVVGNQGDRVVTGVADGIRSNDAANIAQLNQVKSTATSAHGLTQKNTSRINNLENQLSKTNKKIDRGLAASAALTGLFQPYGVGKVNFTAGMGGYGSSQAIAIGSGYRINENAAVKAGLAYSGGNNVMYNASFNLEW